MNIKCLFRRHDWKFAYHHGMPMGISTEEALKMLDNGRCYSVDCCTRRDCSAQSRIIDGKRVMLRLGQMEEP